MAGWPSETQIPLQSLSKAADAQVSQLLLCPAVLSSDFIGFQAYIMVISYKLINYPTRGKKKSSMPAGCVQFLRGHCLNASQTMAHKHCSIHRTQTVLLSGTSRPQTMAEKKSPTLRKHKIHASHSSKSDVHNVPSHYGSTHIHTPQLKR